MKAAQFSFGLRCLPATSESGLWSRPQGTNQPPLHFSIEMADESHMRKLHWLKYFENLMDGVCIIDRTGNVEWSNLSFANMVGLSEKRLVGSSLPVVLNLSSDELNKIGDLKKITIETPYYRFVTRREDFTQELGLSLIPIESESSLIAIIRDFSLEKQLHEKYQTALKQKEELYKTHQRKLFQSLFLVTLSETANKVKEPIEILNRFLPQINEFFGYAAVTTFLEKNGQLTPTSHALSNTITESQLEVLELNLENEIEVAFRDRTIKTIAVNNRYNVALVPFYLGDRSLGVTFCVKDSEVEIHRDEIQMIQAIGQQTALCMESSSLREASNSDDLTKVFNSRYFHKVLGELTQDSSSPPVSLIFVDVDYFKKVNDTYGHPAGDQILRRVAQALKDGLRSSEIVCRYGGEEFGVILPGCLKEEAYHVAERLRKAIMALRFDEINKVLRITVSMGIGCFPIEATDKSSLIESADQALYEAKRSGRNKVCIFKHQNAA